MNTLDRFRILWLSLLIVVVSVSISCDEQGTIYDDDDDADGDFHISVDGSMKMSVMTSYEAYQLCKDVANGFNQVINGEVQCLRKAIAAGQIAGESGEEICNDAFLGCADEKMDDYQACDKFEETAEKYEDCDAKVSLMDKCVKKTIEALEDEYEDLSCEVDEMKDPCDLELCDACKELEEKCPGITTNFDRQF